MRSAERQFARARKTASDDEDERLYGTDEAHERERLETEVAVIEEKLQDEMDAAQGAVKEKAQAAIKRIEEQAAADKEALEAKHRAALAELRKEGGKQAELDNADREYDCVAEEHREEKDARLEALEAERGAGQRAMYQSWLVVTGASTFSWPATTRISSSTHRPWPTAKMVTTGDWTTMGLSQFAFPMKAGIACRATP